MNLLIRHAHVDHRFRSPTACHTNHLRGFITPLQALAWAAVAWVSVLIVASRKHYSVDVLIAW
jgi:PAP2 superfamily C-terminal